MSRAIVAYEICGCTAAISVLDGYEADAYTMAAKQTKAGRRVVIEDVAVWKTHPLYCSDHPDGPPWWRRNGGKGKAPAEYAPQQDLGL